MRRVSRRRWCNRDDGQDGILQGFSTPSLFLLDPGVGLICLGVMTSPPFTSLVLPGCHQPVSDYSSLRTPFSANHSMPQIQRRCARISARSPRLQGGPPRNRFIPKRPHHRHLLSRVMAELHLFRTSHCRQNRSSLCRSYGHVGDMCGPGAAGRRQRAVPLGHGHRWPYRRRHGHGCHLDERAALPKVSRSTVART